MKGFGKPAIKTVIKVAMAPMLGRMMKVYQLDDGTVLLDINYGAKAVDKDPSHLVHWIENSPSAEVIKVACGKKICYAMEPERYVDFLRFEAKNDSPSGSSMELSLVQSGMDDLVKEAQSAGQEFITMPTGHKVRFYHHPEHGRVFNADDLAAMLGTTTDELEQTVNSEKFKRFRELH